MSPVDSGSFENVFWLGGSPCSGKSSVSRILAQRFHLDLFSVDEALPRQLPRLHPDLHPCLTRWLQLSWDERWMRPDDELLQEVISCYSEHFSLVLEDLSSRDPNRGVLVEGCALLPDLVTPLLTYPQRGVWMVPSWEFQMNYYAQRTWAREVLSGCADPEAAFANWMKRDHRFSLWLSERTRHLGLRLLSVDGSRSVDQNADWAAGSFLLSSS